MTFDEGRYYITFSYDNPWKSKFMALENTGFFLLHCGHPEVR